MTVVALSENGDEAVEHYRALQPDVVLMDLRMPVRDGVDAIEAIRDEFSAARIIVLTTFHTEEDIYKGLRAGAMSYLVKGVPTEELLMTIRAAYGGKKRILPEIATKLTERMSSPELTAREMDVLGLSRRWQQQTRKSLPHWESAREPSASIATTSSTNSTSTTERRRSRSRCGGESFVWIAFPETNA